MENLTINRVFGIPEDYTLEQLKKSYIDTIQNLLNSDRTQLEKDLLSDQYKKMYYKGKQLYLDRVSMETDAEYPNYYQNSNNYQNNNELELYDRFDRMFDNSFGLRRNLMRSYNPFSMYDNIFTQLDKQTKQNLNYNKNAQVYSYSSSYSSKTNPDGSKTIVEHKTEMTNDDKKKTINAYKKMPDGKVINLNDDEIKQLEKISNLKIEN
jgi:hypothetical protein